MHELSCEIVSTILNMLLALCFAAISIGAMLDGRLQAWPLVFIFGGFAAYGAIRAVASFRRRRRGRESEGSLVPTGGNE
jgi:hypothetical protein